jgi:hypothetical protein
MSAYSVARILKLALGAWVATLPIWVGVGHAIAETLPAPAPARVSPAQRHVYQHPQSCYWDVPTALDAGAQEDDTCAIWFDEYDQLHRGPLWLVNSWRGQVVYTEADLP